jgi:hypothetical protein
MKERTRRLAEWILTQGKAIEGTWSELLGPSNNAAMSQKTPAFISPPTPREAILQKSIQTQSSRYFLNSV